MTLEDGAGRGIADEAPDSEREQGLLRWPERLDLVEQVRANKKRARRLSKWEVSNIKQTLQELLAG